MGYRDVSLPTTVTSGTSPCLKVAHDPGRVAPAATISMLKFAQTCERIAGTPKKLEKVAIVGEYIKSCPIDQAVVSAVFLSGRPFSVWEETTLNVGGALLWQTVSELAGKSEAELTGSYRKFGDLGSVAGAVLPPKKEAGADSPGTVEVQKTFRELA